MTELNILLGTSIGIAFIHTLIGVDHYVPFIALAGANKWPVKKTLFIVILCGLGHVVGSIILGFAGIALSSGLTSLVHIEDIRGELATYFLIAFGLVYTVFGIRRAMKNKTHTHTNENGETVMHAHNHNTEEHKHGVHNAKKARNVFWGLFILFVLGPCEPLIPILMYPAATQNMFALAAVTVSFAVCTISTMLVMTYLGLRGIHLIKINKLERYSHVLAGSAILLCGISVLVLPI